MTQVFEKVPSVENEAYDGNTHSHIFPTVKSPPFISSIPARKKKKIIAKKPSSRTVSSTVKIYVPDDLSEIFKPIGQEEPTPTSPKTRSSRVI